MKEEKLRPSEFYWGIYILTALGLLILGEVRESEFSYILSILVFLMALFIGHNKKAKEKLDYETHDTEGSEVKDS